MEERTWVASLNTSDSDPKRTPRHMYTVSLVSLRERPCDLANMRDEERAIGLRVRFELDTLRLDPRGDPTGLEPGMTIWFDP